MNSPKLKEPNEEVQLDFAGPLYPDKKSYTYLLVAIDRFSKFPSAMVTNSTSSKKVIKFLTEYSALHGVPQNISLDQATGFTSAEFENFCNNTGINIIPCPIEDHRANGLVER